MDVVQFIAEHLGGDIAVSIRVNGRELRDLAGAVERPYADAEGKSDLAGGYEGLHPWAIAYSADHFLGDPTASWFEDGDTVLLGCTCGEWGCWPLTATVEVTDSVVSWTRFRTGHRDWDLSALGPFEFSRAAYERALDTIRSTLADVGSRSH